LVDGKEYAIPDGGVTIGRDASADIVVAQTSVSRRHAQVIASGNGYLVNDLSTNGIFVNGEKVNASQSLSRADVIRVGTEEFRFYADVAPIAPKAAAPAAPAVAPPPVAAAPTPPTPPRAPSSPPTPPQRPATPPPVAAVPPAAPAPRPAAPPAPSAKPTGSTPPGPVKASPPPVKSPPPPSPVKASPPPPTPERAKEAAEDAAREPVTMKKGIPSWAGILVIIAIAAVAGYFIYASRR
jgi:hypothetical protein